MPTWLVGAWTDYLGPWLSWAWSLPLWQPLTLILLTAAWAAYKWRRALALRVLGNEDRAHDVALFRKLDAMANETFVDNVINTELYTLSADVGRLITLWEFGEALRRIENRYLDTVVRQRAEALERGLGELRHFTHGTFFSIGEGRVKFRPEMIDSKVWDREHAELKDYIERAWAVYTEYRQAVKDRLRT
jgi:hypothetical protein